MLRAVPCVMSSVVQENDRETEGGCPGFFGSVYIQRIEGESDFYTLQKG